MTKNRIEKTTIDKKEVTEEDKDKLSLFQNLKNENFSPMED